MVRDQSGGLRRLNNAEIAKNPQYADFSLDQGKLSVEDFYDRMDDVMSPSPLDPLSAMKEAITSLEEQVKTRVTSVENGRKFQNTGKGDANMPDGPAIFETTGAWEDFSTPSRDLRLLIAIDVVRGFPDRVARRPERYAMPTGKSAAEVKAQLQSVLASELASRKFSYPRSDGSQWTLALKDVAERAVDLEMAYNPNDCVELRWGARAGSDEGRDLQAAGAAGAAREDDQVPRLVQRTAPAAARLTSGFPPVPRRPPKAGCRLTCIPSAVVECGARNDRDFAMNAPTAAPGTAAKTAFKELVFSGMQPSGNLHLGNYLGAIVKFVELQDRTTASTASSTCTPSRCGRTRRSWPGRSAR